MYLVLATLTLLCVHLVLQFINITYFSEQPGNFHELTNRFDFDDEASIPTWFSQLLFLILASLAGVTAYIERKKKKSYWVWLTIAIVATLGSIDEVSTVHESGLQGIHLIFFDENTPTLLANAWIVILPVVLTFCVIFAFRASKVLPQKTLKLFILAVGIYLTGAVGVDIVTSSVTIESLYVKHGLLVALEEAMELIGLSLAIYTTAEYLRANYANKFKGIKKQLRQ